VDLPALTAQHVPRLTEMRLQARELRIEDFLDDGAGADALGVTAPREVAAWRLGGPVTW
jgi:hypothetical protein